MVGNALESRGFGASCDEYLTFVNEVKEYAQSINTANKIQNYQFLVIIFFLFSENNVEFNEFLKYLFPDDFTFIAHRFMTFRSIHEKLMEIIKEYLNYLRLAAPVENKDVQDADTTFLKYVNKSEMI